MRRAIARKRDGFALDPSQWRSIVSAYLAGGVDDAQMAALLMASLCRGLNEDETLALTDAFVASGETLRPPGARVVDKHSSGGVGDSTSLIVVPWVAACGVVVAKLSGRALGHTGGTLDKMEAVEGVRTELEPHEFFVCLERAGCAIAAQSARLVPADKRIYALRDRTATVPSLGLIAASIASKKIAGGAHAIVYDVKTGRGALLPRFDQARRLAETLVELSERFGRGATALVSDMDEPLGPSIGTGLEVCEARDFLRGRRRDPRLETLCFALAEAMLRVVSFPGDARAALRRALAGGAAAERFEAMLRAQGALPGALERLAPHAVAADAHATGAGFVHGIDAVSLGETARTAVDRAGPRAGVFLRKRIGDPVQAGEPLATVYGDAALAPAIGHAFDIQAREPAKRPVIYVEIGSRATVAGGSAARSTLETK
jgi:pyrimidine-nucleoside phosphorylase